MEDLDNAVMLSILLLAAVAYLFVRLIRAAWKRRKH